VIVVVVVVVIMAMAVVAMEMKSAAVAAAAAAATAAGLWMTGTAVDRRRWSTPPVLLCVALWIHSFDSATVY
jgi:hypothetical protein